MGEAQCDQCGGTGWYLTPPLECRDGKMRRTRCKCGCGKAGLTDLARENAELRARLAAAERERDDQKAQLKDNSKTHEKFIDELWQAIIVKHSPDYGDWEYPAQAFRHLVAEVDFVRERLADAEKARDEQAEAKRVLAQEISEWRLAHVCSPVSLIDAPIIRARKRTANNPTAAAAVKEASNG